MQIEQLYKIYQQNPFIQTDTRKIKKGELFFALKGDNFNGNHFARQAIDSGASFAIIDEKEYEIAGKTILTDNVLTSLQDMARYHRQQFEIPFIAITGSNGKTTTKELIHAVLNTTYNTYTTEGNLNNHIGIPLTILKIRKDAQIAIIEMGANHKSEIASYCKFTLPTHGIITNVGKAHLEGFGSLEGVKKGKGELFDFLRGQPHGYAFVMWDYEYLREMSKGISGIIKYGTGDAHITGHVKKNDPYLEMEITQGLDDPTIETHLVGDYNMPNILAAITVGKTFKVPEENIRSAIKNYEPTNSRSQLMQKGSNSFILDAYNANPSSMRLAIENFGKYKSALKVVMLGAMAELGKESLTEHQTILNLLGQYQWTEVILVGGDFLKLNHSYRTFENASQTREWFQQQQFENTHFLIKGSRSMQMEKVLENEMEKMNE
ncbi:MAG: UDP-N-acetylmuramoyl-tripeptide--D-alanyl-D-alanine ligase [Chitinophagaceae bacterium]